MKEQNELLKSLPADFFKQFKTGQEFRGFMDALFKRGVEEMLMRSIRMLQVAIRQAMCNDVI